MGRPPPEFNESFQNIDSVLIDTCYDSPTFNKLFVDGPYQIELEYNIIPRTTLYPKDTLITYTIDDILSKYNTIKEEFKDLKSELGEFYFFEPFPDKPDTNSFVRRSLRLQFTSNIEINSTLEKLEAINGIFASSCEARFGYLTSVESDNQKAEFRIYPNPAKNQISINSWNKSITFQENLKIFDLNGRELMRFDDIQSDVVMDVNTLETGIYLVQIGEFFQRIIIQGS